MAVPSTITDLSTTAASNSPAGTDTITSTTGPDDYMRALAALMRREQAQAAAVASATTVDLGAIADGSYVHITGTTTITGLGTVAAGVSRVLVFDGILTFTHNATSLILPGGASVTTAAGDIAVMVSEGSGNWRCVNYHLSSAGEHARCAAYKWTNWSPSDLAGTPTTAPNSGTGTANNGFISYANSAGTVTITFAKAGTYQVSISDQTTHAAAYSYSRVRTTIGGTATRYIESTVLDDNGQNADDSNTSMGITFGVVATAGQTLTIVATYELTGSGVVGNHVASLNFFAAYCSA